MTTLQIVCDYQSSYDAGDVVRLHGLSSEAFNGKNGRVMHFVKAKGRYAVMVDGESKGLTFKVENMKLLGPANPKTQCFSVQHSVSEPKPIKPESPAEEMPAKEMLAETAKEMPVKELLVAEPVGPSPTSLMATDAALSNETAVTNQNPLTCFIEMFGCLKA